MRVWPKSHYGSWQVYGHSHVAQLRGQGSGVEQDPVSGLLLVNREILVSLGHLWEVPRALRTGPWCPACGALGTALGMGRVVR